MKNGKNTAFVLVTTAALVISGASAASAKDASPVSVTLAPTSKQAAIAALNTAAELLVGTLVKDSAGCLYAVGASNSSLSLVPVVIDGKHVCSASK